MSEMSLDLGLDVTEAPTAAEPFAGNFYRGKAEYAGPFYTIQIAHVEYAPEYEVIGVNGEVLQVQRGVDVPNIPEAFVQVLRNAIASRQVKRRNPDQTEYYEWVPYPAIPWQLVEGPYKKRKEV